METQTKGFLEDVFILDSAVVRACLCIAYTAVFIICFFGTTHFGQRAFLTQDDFYFNLVAAGNLIVVTVVSLHWRMRSVTKFGMGNLAFANLCVAVFCIYQNLSTFLQEK